MLIFAYQLTRKTKGKGVRMKRVFIVISFLMIVITASAQSVDSTSVDTEDPLSHLTVEEMKERVTPPQFPHGLDGLKRYLKKNVKYPTVAVKYDVQGRVLITFVVEKDGTVSHVSVRECKVQTNNKKFKKLSADEQKELKKQFALIFAREGMRVVQEMPQWCPAQLDGESVKMNMKLPIKFAL